jgi:sortase A
MAAGVDVVSERRNAPSRPGPEPMGPWWRTLREIGLALITLGVIIFLFIGYELWGTGLAESHSQAALKKGFNAAIAHPAPADSPAVGATPTNNPGPAIGGAVDHLVIPKIGVDKYVVQGVSEDALRRGPGHYPQTVMPGQYGNAAIAGHRTTYGAPFFRLNELSVGDYIYVTDTARRTFMYRVSRAPLVVSPSDVSVLDPTPYAQLTLTTCNPRFSATSRLIILARLTNRRPLPVTTPTTAPVTTHATTPVKVAAAPVAESLGAGDQNAWPAALLYGTLVVGLWVIVRVLINRTRRWARLGIFVAGVGLCLIPLWFCFENVVLLLPQNI